MRFLLAQPGGSSGGAGGEKVPHPRAGLGEFDFIFFEFNEM
jgi:hypothetical protein